jgi:hypothetical protein
MPVSRFASEVYNVLQGKGSSLIFFLSLLVKPSFFGDPLNIRSGGQNASGLSSNVKTSERLAASTSHFQAKSRTIRHFRSSGIRISPSPELYKPPIAILDKKLEI